MSAADWLTGGVKLVLGTARSLPGGRTVEAFVVDAERQVVRAVRQHLDELEAPAIEPVPDPIPLPIEEATPAERHLRDLMDRSMYNTPAESRAELHLALLESLVPDEARILAAVSDGATYPVIHVGEPGGVGTAPTYVLRNASTVGRAAGVSLPVRTPLYLSRMLRLELLRLGPEDTTLRDEYEMLLTDGAVHAAITAAGKGLRPARVVRRIVTISELGQEVWEAAK